MGAAPGEGFARQWAGTRGPFVVPLIIALLLLAPTGAAAVGTGPHGTAVPLLGFAGTDGTVRLAARAISPAAFVPSPSGIRGATLLSPASAGAVLRTLFPNYNATLPGNFSGSVAGWQIGTPAYDPVTGLLWLPNRAVAVGSALPPPVAPAILYNATTNQFEGFVPSLENTSAFAYDPANGRIYSADYANGTVGVVDPSTRAWIHRAIPVGVQPAALALNGTTGQLYVANKGSDNITIIDTGNESVAIGGIPLGGSQPFALALDGVDRRLFVADAGDRSLRTVSTATNSTGSVIPLLALPGGLSYSSSTGTLAVTMPSQALLVLVNGSSLGYKTVPVQTGMSPIDANTTGTSFTLGNGAGSDLETVNASSGAVEGSSILVGDKVATLVPGPSNQSIFVWASGSRNISVVDLNARSVSAVSPTLGPLPGSVAYDPTTNRLFVADRSGSSVIVLNATSGAASARNIGFGSEVFSVAVDPISNLLYVGTMGAVDALDAQTGSLAASNTGLSGINDPLLIDAGDSELWVANNQTSLVALDIGNLTTRFAVTVPVRGTGEDTMALDPSLHELFVINATSGALDVIDTVTGEILSSGVPAGPAPSALAYDSADGLLYVLGSNLTAIDPVTRQIVASDLPLPAHSFSLSIAFDASRSFLYITTSGPAPAYPSTVTVLDGSSLTASSVSMVTIPVGQLASDVVPAMLSGSSTSSYAPIWVTNYAAETVSLITSPPAITYFRASPDRVDAGQSAQFLLGTSGGSGAVMVSYSGLPPGCSSANTATLNCTALAAGNYTVSATVTDSYGLAASATTALVVGIGPTARIGFGPGSGPIVDVGTNLSMLANVTGGTSPYNETWYFGDNSVAYGPTVVHRYLAPGFYLVNLTVKDASQVVVATSAGVQVNPPPACAIAVSPSNRTDLGVPISLRATVAGGTSPGTSTWAFGDGSNATGLAVSHAWVRAGTYTVDFRYVDAVGSVATAVLGITVGATLNAVFSIRTPASGTSFDAGQALDFVATVTGGVAPYNVSWSFGDGSFGGGLFTTHSYGNAGSYSISVVLTDAGGGRVNATLPLSVGGVGTGTASPDAQLFLGILIGGAIAAIILFVTGRPRRGPPPPPSPYVPPAGIAEPEWKES